MSLSVASLFIRISKCLLLFIFLFSAGAAHAISQDLEAENQASRQDGKEEAGRNVVGVDEEKPEPGQWINQFLDFLKTDSDQQAKSAAQFAQALITLDRLDEARQLASQFASGYRKPVLFYTISEKFFLTGDRELSDTLFAEAEAAGKGIMDFEKEEILSQRIHALAVRGNLDQARTELDKILSVPIRIDTEARLFEFELEQNAKKNALLFISKENVPPSHQGRVLLFVAELQRKAGDGEEAKQTVIEAAEAICKKADPETIPLLRIACGLLAKMGETKEAERWAKVVLGFAERTSSKAYWKPRDMRLAAESLQDAGAEKEAQEVFAKIPNLVGELDLMSYSQGGVEAAQAFLLTGKEELFEEATAHVLRLTRHHPHYRARAMAAVDVLTAFLSAKRELPLSAQRELRDTIKSVENDPHFQHPQG